MDWTAFTVNLVSIVLAFAAFWLSWKEVHRCNNVVLSLEEIRCSNHMNIYENGAEPFQELSIHLRNRGVSLHDVVVSLSFNDPAGGRFNHRLSSSTGETQRPGEFSRGMVGKFYFKSYLLDETSRAMLVHLKDPYIQNCCLVVSSQSYTAKIIPVGRWGDGVRDKWNRLAFKFNRLFWHNVRIVPDGPALLKTPKVVPGFTILRNYVTRFVDAVRKEDVNPKETPEPPSPWVNDADFAGFNTES